MFILGSVCVALGVLVLVLAGTVYFQTTEIERLELRSAVDAETTEKYISWYNSEFSLRTSAQHERDEALAAQASLLRNLALPSRGGVNHKSKHVVRGKRVGSLSKKKRA